MSETYYIACMDCRECVWIGQRDWIYTEAQHLKVLERFFYSHQKHELQFLGLDVLNGYTDWKEIVVPNADGSYDSEDLDEDHIRFDEWLEKKSTGQSIR